MRIALGASTSTRAMMMLNTDDPSTAMIAKPRMMPGKAMNASTKRCTTRSTLPPKYALTAPRKDPMDMPIAMLTRPTNSEMRPP